MYGPASVLHKDPLKYYENRVLPRLFGNSTEMFRFQACRFKAEEHYKENCARFWVEGQGIQYSYCLECSQQGYYSTAVEPGKRVIIEFNA
jgi:hypothetical protein